MFISQVVVRNYRCLRKADVSFHQTLNVIVGNNECGKSTLLEAIHVALSGQLNGRPIQTELHPFLFNTAEVAEYLEALVAKKAVAPPAILIEVYFADSPELAKLRGTNNSKKADVPGVAMSIEFNRDYAEEFERYLFDPLRIRTLPIEYYAVRWRGFSDGDITARSVPVRPSFIDASTIRNNVSANRYVADTLRDSLSKSDKIDLALSYRLMRDRFLSEDKVKKVNEALAAKGGNVSEKVLSVSLDTSSRSSWESGMMPHLDEIPLTLVGKGEQSAVKIKLALESSAESNVVLIEEAENHLSYSNLNTLISHIAERRGTRQIVITTHSSFVLNKLGVDSVILFSHGSAITLPNLSGDTQDYFMRLPGHDTLRLILAKRAILVEGPSDELIVQAAFRKKYGKMPLEAGVDVIAVNSLAFKRFLEIAVALNRPVVVVTDNDGNVARLKKKYADYEGKLNVDIVYDINEKLPTLEPHLLDANGQGVVEAILDRTFGTPEELLAFMESNKTDCALKFFETNQSSTVPGYIQRAVG
jgi:putative ATP-dependent endonuclease of the OLD family